MRKFTVVMVLFSLLTIPFISYAKIDNETLVATDKLLLLITIELPDVSGRIDHMDFDPKGHRLFVAALGNNSVEVIDVKASKRIGTIAGLNSPQGVLYIEEFKCIAISNAGDGSVQFYNSESLTLNRTVALGNDADNMRYDSTTRQIFVGCGDGALAVMDAATGRLLTSMKLPGHPESFELESKGKRIFINVPGANQIVVVDRERKTHIASWKNRGLSGNFPMALDENNHRLFIGFRGPPKLLVLNSETGQEIARPDCVGDADDIFYDDGRKRIYISGGAGGIDVFRQIDSDHYNHVSRTSTAFGARTSFLVPEPKTLCVAVPRIFMRAAQIRVYGLP